MTCKAAQFQTLALYLLAVICIITAAWWIPAVISFRQPLQVPTAGCTGEALNDIWKAAHGMPVYTDITRMPFSSSYFNWLHYASYGFVCHWFMNLTGLGDEWIPTVSSSLSVLVSVLGALFMAQTCRLSLSETCANNNRIALAMGTAAFFGPLLMGWNVSPRPDAPALMFEAAGMMAAMTGIRSKQPQIAAWLIAGLCFFAAWSFRVINVGCLAGVLAWLLIQRQWRPMAAVLVPCCLLIATTFLLGGKGWLDNALLGSAICPFGLAYGVEAMTLAVLKSPLIVAALVTGLWSLFRSGRLSDASLWFWVLAASLILAFVTSCKWGSNQNYWFSSQLAALGVLAEAWGGRVQGQPSPYPRWFPLMTTVCLLLMSVVELGYLSGRLRAVDTTANERMATLKASLKGMPGPMLVRGGYFENLPWITGQQQPFVYAFTYYLLRPAGKQLERDGLRGLIKEGWFNTVVYPAEYEPSGPTDGAPMDHYEVVKKDTYFTYFKRKP